MVLGGVSSNVEERELMAETAAEAFSSYNVVVDVQGMKAGFSEVTGLPSQTSVAKSAILSLKRGLTNNRAFWDWCRKTIAGQTQRLPGTVTLRDQSGNAIAVWKFNAGLPSKFTSPAFNAAGTDVAIEELTITVEGLALQ